MAIETVQDALDWLACNIEGYKEDYISIIKLQALINRVEVTNDLYKIDFDNVKLRKMLSQIREQGSNTMNNQITLKQQLLTITHQKYKVYLKDVNAMNITRLIYDCNIDDSSVLQAYLDYVVESVDENWNITIRSQKIV